MKKNHTLSDASVLDALLASERLSYEEEKAFGGMLEQITRNNKIQTGLSANQRLWADSVYRKLELDADEAPANLVSSGQYVPTKEELEKKHP